MLAYDYPLLGLFWTMLWFYVVFAFIMLLFMVMSDIFRSREMGGFSKAMWLVIVVVIPLLGMLAYMIAHGDDMAARRMSDAAAQDEAMRAYVRDAAGTGGGPGDQIARLVELRDDGSISEEEFQTAKAKVLA